jgi:hypothetical protein
MHSFLVNELSLLLETPVSMMELDKSYKIGIQVCPFIFSRSFLLCFTTFHKHLIQRDRAAHLNQQRRDFLTAAFRRRRFFEIDY